MSGIRIVWPGRHTTNTVSSTVVINDASLPRIAMSGSLVGLSAILLTIIVAEVLTVYGHPLWGVMMHLSILVGFATGAIVAPTSATRDVLMVMLLAPLTRVVSLSVPIGEYNRLWWYVVTGVPMLCAAIVVMRSLGLRPANASLTLPRGWWWPLSFLVGASGVVLGGIEYWILRPDPLVASGSTSQLIIAVFILVICTGIVEELIFRGIMQSVITSIIGGSIAIAFTSAVFGVLHLGHLSLPDVAVVTLIGAYFGVVTARSSSLLGATLGHAVTNISLYLVIPMAIG